MILLVSPELEAVLKDVKKVSNSEALSVAIVCGGDKGRFEVG